MASVRKRASGKWQAILWDKTQGKQTSVTLPPSVSTKREAERIALQKQDEMDRTAVGLPLLQNDSEKRTKGWQQHATETLAEVEHTSKGGWDESCQRFIDRFTDFIGGDCPPDELSEEDARKYLLQRLADGASASYIRKEITFLARVFRRSGNPIFANVKKPTEPMRPPSFLTRAQFQSLLDASPEHRKFRYLVLALTGARRGEAWEMRWADIDLQNNVIAIKNSAKGRGPRYPFRKVPICTELHLALAQEKTLLADNAKPEALLFKNYNNWNRDFDIDCGKAQIGQWRIHDLRHTYASWLAQSGVITLHRLRDLMGHGTIAMTERYAHLIPTADLDAARALNALSGFRDQNVTKKQAPVDFYEGLEFVSL